MEKVPRFAGGHSDDSAKEVQQGISVRFSQAPLTHCCHQDILEPGQNSENKSVLAIDCTSDILDPNLQAGSFGAENIH